MILWHHDMNCYNFKAFSYIELTSCCLPTPPNVAPYSIPNHPSRRYNAINNIWLDPMLAWNATKRVVQHDPKSFMIIRQCISCVVDRRALRKLRKTLSMMTSWSGNIFRVAGPFCGEFISHRWIPSTKASGAELWCFLWSWPEQKGWVSNRDAGNLRRHCADYGVTIMFISMDAEMMIHYIRNKIPYCPRLRDFLCVDVIREYLKGWHIHIFSGKATHICLIVSVIIGGHVYRFEYFT